MEILNGAKTSFRSKYSINYTTRHILLNWSNVGPNGFTQYIYFFSTFWLQSIELCQISHFIWTTVSEVNHEKIQVFWSASWNQANWLGFSLVTFAPRHANKYSSPVELSLKIGTIKMTHLQIFYIPTLVIFHIATLVAFHITTMLIFCIQQPLPALLKSEWI